MDKYRVCIAIEKIHVSVGGWFEHSIVGSTGLSLEFTSEKEAKEAYLKLSKEMGRQE